MYNGFLYNAILYNLNSYNVIRTLWKTEIYIYIYINQIYVYNIYKTKLINISIYI